MTEPGGGQLGRMRRALIRTIDRRGLELSALDIEALARTAVAAGTWLDDDQLALRIPQRSTAESRRNWCSQYDVPRVTMVPLADVERALQAMPSQARHRDRERQRRRLRGVEKPEDQA